jgi:hypothetical protein
MTPRVSIGGSRGRVRISNAYGVRPLTIGAAYVGVRGAGPAMVPGSNRRLTFDQKAPASPSPVRWIRRASNKPRYSLTKADLPFSDSN